MTNVNLKHPAIIEFKDIPDTVYNRKLTEEQRHRLASGMQSGLIKDLVVEEGKNPIDAKITASKNEEGKLVLTYDYAEKNFRMPYAILGVTLSNEHKDLLFNGDLLAIRYKGEDLYIGIDRDLNKVTVKSGQQMGIPNEVGDYQLTGVDKYYLAGGKETPTHLFSTKEGNYFTANFSMTKDGTGMSYTNIKFVDRENAAELRLKYNVDQRITDQKYMLPAVSEVVRENSEPKPIVKGKIVTSPIENSLRKQDEVIHVINERGNYSESPGEKPRSVAYPEKVLYHAEKTDEGFNLKSEKYFVPNKLKGVTLTEEQKDALAKGEKTLIQGMSFKGSNTDAYVQFKPDASGFDWDFNTSEKMKVDKVVSKQNDIIRSK